MIEIITTTLLFFLFYLSIYLLVRNHSTWSILDDCLWQWREFTGNHKKFKEVQKIIERYSYDKILFSFRPIISFQRELNSDIAKIRNAKQNE